MKLKNLYWPSVDMYEETFNERREIVRESRLKGLIEFIWLKY